MHTKVSQNNQVSMIIVNWNSERFLERCLAALMAQTLKPHEIILVDNASSDRSLEIARQLPFVRLVGSEYWLCALESIWRLRVWR
jgi:glycosyltransferase involved in cell wall biosynthesis